MKYLTHFFIVLLLVIMLYSCSKTSEVYYENSMGEEAISLTDDTLTNRIFFTAHGFDDKLKLMIGYKLTDTSLCLQNTIDSISFTVNNLNNGKAKYKYLFFSDSTSFEAVNKIYLFSEKVRSGNPLTFVYVFDNDDIENPKELKINIGIAFNKFSNKKSIHKSIILKGHNRYKNWFANS